MPKYNTICLIVAAGSGTRAGDGLPKQYLPIGGIPVLRHTILKFLEHKQIDAVKVVYNPAHQALYDKATAGLNILPPVAGGDTRQESVRLGLNSLKEYKPEKVLIHDAARVFVSQALISSVIDALEANKAVIPVIPLEDSIKKCSSGKVVSSVEREGLYRAQTPQGFAFADILAAHEEVRSKKLEVRSDKHTSHFSLLTSNFTDDSSLFEHLGKEVVTIQGEQDNFKITSQEDFKKAEIFMAQTYEIRTGTGFDAHKFCAPKNPDNNHIMLCGVPVPHDFSLEGHSDADVGLHAAVDAILGAISAGDIGQHFPPSDLKWQGADSSIFLARAAKLLTEKNGKINNLDITIICEKPKVTPYREKMCKTIAKILDIEKSRVSVKATTTEGMGFTGRKEGMAAMAAVTVKLEVRG